MAPNDRREFQRLRLAKPILALLDGQNTLILDIGISGAFIEHYGEPKPGSRVKLLFRWKGTDVEFQAEVAHTIVIRRSGSSIVSHSGLRF
ncbi:MAG TPA: PilZ domain-containing protein, partial [Thermoanaerobaculia bacterium]|nr:PilZ domain-containing protein [Thermoanaerobaculia bacterium]